MTIRIPASLSKVNASTLISFTINFPADDWGPAMDQYTVMEASSMRNMLRYGRVSCDQIVGAEIFSTRRAVDISK